MGNEVSNEQRPKVGYHVLNVYPNSPGKIAGLVSFFDFIVAADGIYFEKDDGAFVEMLKKKLGQEVKITVYNSRSETARELVLVPSDSWGGSGLAGISIRFCSFELAHEFVWHVLDVYQNSPASEAGLVPRTDYIVGTPELLFSDADDFFTLINFNEGKPLPLYVYNCETDEVRLVTIIPNKNWGGTGSLGCDVGFGILHRIPRVDPSELEKKQTQSISSPKSPKFANPGFVQVELPSQPQFPLVQQLPFSSTSPTSNSPFVPSKSPQQPSPVPLTSYPPNNPISYDNQVVDWNIQQTFGVPSSNYGGETSPFLHSYPSPTQQKSTPTPSEFQDVKI